ncbi:ABC transporter permease [Vibrio sp. 10N.286.49.C2]|uniref:ABC transporter permease n=1 Tax=unclassified Vibrio TaxID=2614977 RepID=UPI000C84BE3D|nr:MULTISPECIES: ABC transporter permease [unclassified Vibrio]PMH31621.1 ABC transporter permease [Vibrio sp. 10N.286.49.C2]PMH50643.1 ABC transporter permease [Vibrio sp. 10N.286.49.B1]PMH79310.1 ABC transporter permease [Vibrio sp. 10N.286.48.B7]
MLLPVVKALLGHYRRHPLQILLVWLGLTLGVSLLVGVTAINHHAKQAYASGEKLFANPVPYRIRPKHAETKIPQGFYVQLRREGFKQCVPFDMHKVMTADDLELNLVGVDPVALLQLKNSVTISDLASQDLMKVPTTVVISADLAEHKGWQAGDIITLKGGRQIGPIKIDTKKGIRGTRILADMSLLRSLKKSSGLSVIACGDMSSEKLEALRKRIPNGMTLSRSSQSQLEALTKAFHTNLTAMSMLSFVVGLFIFYQAMSLSLAQRQPLVGSLRQLGVSGWQLAQALCLELAGLVFLSWWGGNVLGLLLANQLIPAVSQSLSDLYDANIGLSIEWSWEWSMYSFLLAFFGAVISCGWPLVRLLKSQPIRLSSRLSLMRFTGAEFTWQAFVACGFCVAAIAIYQAPKSQSSGYAIIVLMLLSVALITPFIIWKVFTALSFSLKWVKVRWFFADAAASMSYRGVANMAFMLAMAANMGVETMVGSFRDTTDRWLTQRLAADIYVYPTNNNADRMSKWLEEQPEVERVWWRWEEEVPTDNGMMQVVSTGDSVGELDSLTVKTGIPNYWYHLHHSKGVMISESMALKQKLRPGDYLDLGKPLGKNWQVIGVYYDYGNPYDQVLMSQNRWLASFAGSGDVALGAVLNDKEHSVMVQRRLQSTFRLNTERIYDNTTIHREAMQTFDRTFAIADTLGNITLVIAVFGIFFATIAGEVSRQRHTSLLRCFGISGRELVIVGGLQLLVFGLISAAIAMPLGIALAQLIVDIVIKQSFGWSLQLQIVPWQYLTTSLWSLLALVVAGAIPVLRLIRNSPINSLRDAL